MGLISLGHPLSLPGLASGLRHSGEHLIHLATIHTNGKDRAKLVEELLRLRGIITAAVTANTMSIQLRRVVAKFDVVTAGQIDAYKHCAVQVAVRRKKWATTAVFEMLKLLRELLQLRQTDGDSAVKTPGL